MPYGLSSVGRVFVTGKFCVVVVRGSRITDSLAIPVTSTKVGIVRTSVNVKFVELSFSTGEVLDESVYKVAIPNIELTDDELEKIPTALTVFFKERLDELDNRAEAIMQQLLMR